ncbi:MAG: rhombosortase [Gammaproteobacteria bacterium]|nr:rhombosortase [Gammaproteobacteria bacterium]
MLNRLTARYRPHALPLLLALSAILIAAGGQELALELRFQRASILDGEWWRLLSANLVHLGWPHLAMNLAGLVMIWLLFHRFLSNIAWLVTLIVSSLGVSLGLLWFSPETQWYVGLSGTLHGMFFAGAIAAVIHGYRLELILLLLLCAKLVWEQLYGALPGSADMAGGNVVVDSHLYGAISGILPGLLALKKQPPQQPATTEKKP